MIGLMCLVVGLFGQWLLGLFLAKFILSSNDRSNDPPFVELIGLGFVLGIGATAWTLFLYSFAGAFLGFLPSCLLAIIGFSTGGPVLIQQWKETKRASRNVESAVIRCDFALCQACQGLIALLITVCVLQTLQTPQKLWDERAIFALKAKVLFEDRSIHSPALMHPDFVQYHPRYPLLLPLAEENVYALLGTVDDRLSKIVFSLLYAGMVLATAGVLLRHFSEGRAWLGALVLATAPVLMPYEYGFLCGQADAPVACYHGLSVLYLWDGLRRIRSGGSGSRPLFIAGLCGGLTAFTKDEGIAYLMIDTSILGLCVLGSCFTFERCRRLIQAMIVFVMTTVAVIGPWFLHRRNLPLTTEMNYFGRMTMSLFISRLDTLHWTLPHLLRRMFIEWREWGLQWWLAILALISRPTRAIQPPQLLLILDLVGSLLSLIVAGMVAPAQLDEHIGGSSHRFLMQITPVAILFAVTQFPDSDHRSLPHRAE